MAQILIRDLEPEVVSKLKARAERNRRSLQSEVRVILEEAARQSRIETALARAVEARDRQTSGASDAGEGHDR